MRKKYHLNSFPDIRKLNKSDQKIYFREDISIRFILICMICMAASITLPESSIEIKTKLNFYFQTLLW